MGDNDETLRFICTEYFGTRRFSLNDSSFNKSEIDFLSRRSLKVNWRTLRLFNIQNKISC